MSHVLLDKLLENLEKSDFTSLTSITKEIGATKDLGLILRSEYLMIAYDFMNDDDMTRKREIITSFYETIETIEQLRLEFKDSAPQLNLYDEYAIENIASEYHTLKAFHEILKASSSEEWLAVTWN
jgi:hypothetical protein